MRARAHFVVLAAVMVAAAAQAQPKGDKPAKPPAAQPKGDTPAKPPAAQPKGDKPAKPPGQPKGAKPPKPPPAPAVDMKGVQAKLKSGDAARTMEGLTAAQAGGAAAAGAVGTIEDLLKKGTSAPLAKAAVEALGAIGAQSSSAVIRPYIRHRNADVRRAAIRAIGAKSRSKL